MVVPNGKPEDSLKRLKMRTSLGLMEFELNQQLLFSIFTIHIAQAFQSIPLLSIPSSSEAQVTPRSISRNDNGV